MFCQLFSLQNKSFLCLQHVENKGFQTVIKHRLKAIQKPIKNELGNRKKNTKNAHFVLKKCTFRFRDYIPTRKKEFHRQSHTPDRMTAARSCAYIPRHTLYNIRQTRKATFSHQKLKKNSEKFVL